MSTQSKLTVGCQPCKRLIAPLVLFVVFVFFTFGCAEPEQKKAETPRPVVVITLKAGDPSESLRLTGSVEPWAEEDVAFEVAGRVQYIAQPGTALEGRWEENGKVLIKGSVLGRLDPSVYEASVSAAEADLERARVNAEKVLPEQLAVAEAENERAEKEYRRILGIKNLDPGAVSQQQVDTTLANRDASRAKVQQAKAQLAGAQAEIKRAMAALVLARLDLGKATLRAPFPGEVSEVYVQAGGYASVGQKAAHLVMMDPVNVTVNVSAETNRRIVVGDSAHVYVQGHDEPIVGKVERKSTVANPGTRTFAITLLVRNIKTLVDPPADEKVLSLPRAKRLLPVVQPKIRSLGVDRSQITASGPLFVEEKEALRKDRRGYFVWLAEGVSFLEGLDPANPVFTVRKIRVVPGKRRINYQGIYLFRELSKAGKLKLLDPLVPGVPEGVKDGDRIAILQESWLMNPGGLVETRFTRDTGTPGYYVPMQAIVSTDPDSGYVYIVDGQGSSQGGRAQRVAVHLRETIGELQRIESQEANALTEGARVVLEGVNYIKPGDAVSIVRTESTQP